MNGGKCETTGPSSYICKCGDRYRGAKCEVDTDPCRERPCLNNGKIISQFCIQLIEFCIQLIGKQCTFARHFIDCLVLVQPRKPGNCPDMTEKLLTGTSSINTRFWQNQHVEMNMFSCSLVCFLDDDSGL